MYLLKVKVPSEAASGGTDYESLPLLGRGGHIGVNVTVLGALRRLAFVYTLPCVRVTVVCITERNSVLARKIFGEILKVDAVDKQIGK